MPYAADAAGALFAGAAAGMLVGDVVIGRWTSASLRSRLALPLYALLAVPYLAFVLRPGVVLATALVALASFGYAGTLAIQEQFIATVPDRLLGQGMGLAGSGMMTAQAVCAAIVGASAELATPALAMTAAGAVSLAVSLMLLARPWSAAPVPRARREAEATEAAPLGQPLVAVAIGQPLIVQRNRLAFHPQPRL